MKQADLEKAMLTQPPSDPATPVYFCPTCWTAYATEAAAKACARTRLPGAQPIAQGLQPGDFVIVREGYTWAQDTDWIARPGPDWHGKATYDFWFLVTAITAEADDPRKRAAFDDNRHLHQAIVHMATGGANVHAQGEHAGFRCGWTSIRHRTVERADQASVPRKIRRASAHMIGRTFRNCI